MGQQSKKIIKRRRRADYLKRKAEAAKLGGIVKRPAVKKVAAADAPKKAPARRRLPLKRLLRRRSPKGS
jgi:hypothetical protein